MIVLQNDHARAALDRQDFCGACNAVADRGYQRDIIGVGLDQARCRRPCAFVLLVDERSIERPGVPLRPTAARPASSVRSGSGL
jgi:hypothetical protein